MGGAIQLAHSLRNQYNHIYIYIIHSSYRLTKSSDLFGPGLVLVGWIEVAVEERDLTPRVVRVNDGGTEHMVLDYFLVTGVRSPAGGTRSS